ncbi:MAG TPA: hypothetical protein VGY54_14600 [Polyangiaceae bacterium]|jgi:hypothetical protein|nr:hypothetical protein [Polyangiaceae bacterium]
MGQHRKNLLGGSSIVANGKEFSGILSCSLCPLLAHGGGRKGQVALALTNNATPHTERIPERLTIGDTPSHNVVTPHSKRSDSGRIDPARIDFQRCSDPVSPGTYEDDQIKVGGASGTTARCRADGDNRFNAFIGRQLSSPLLGTPRGPLHGTPGV